MYDCVCVCEGGEAHLLLGYAVSSVLEDSLHSQHFIREQLAGVSLGRGRGKGRGHTGYVYTVIVLSIPFLNHMTYVSNSISVILNIFHSHTTNLSPLTTLTPSPPSPSSQVRQPGTC